MKNSIFIGMIIFAGFISGCASTSEKKVSQEVSDQKQIESPNQAVASGRFAIKQSTRLTELEKTRFFEVMDRTQASVAEIKKKEGQLMAALFQSLAERKYDPREIHVYRTKLRKLEDEKLNLMFTSLEEIRHLFGKEQQENLDRELLQYYRAAIDK